MMNPPPEQAHNALTKSVAAAMFRRGSIRTQLLALVLVVALPLLVYAVISIQRQAAELRREASADALVLARQLAARLDEHILHIDSLLIVTAERASLPSLLDWIRMASSSTPLGDAMKTTAAARRAPAPSVLDRARALGLVGAVKGGPSDVAARHSHYLRAKLRQGAARSR